VEIYLPLSGLVDLEEEEERIKNDLEEIKGQIQRLEKLLAGPFAQKAPAEVVNKEKDKLAHYLETSQTLQDQLDNLTGQT
jgi:valyl-tRNA synthetase